MYTLLVVEDDVELNQTVSEVLSGEGYRVLRAHSCREAQRLADSHTLDLAVLDVNLPDGDGFSLCKWLKGRAARFRAVSVRQGSGGGCPGRVRTGSG